ncbi:MAG: alpha-L-fucosidase [Oscillospiraceae bacterium]|nr:alpha-L-fucosidase [Oscillospiraceae bacterium]
MKRWTMLRGAMAVMVTMAMLAGLAGIMPAALAEEQPDTASFLPGDVDGNGEVQVTDARLILQYLVDKIELEPIQLIAADVDGNGVSISSARLVLQYLVGKVSGFPNASRPEEPKPGYVPANSVFEAAQYDDAALAGSAAANELAADFTSFGGVFFEGDQMVYKDIDFGDGAYTALMMLIAANADYSAGKIEVYADEILPENLIAAVTPPKAAKDENVFYECYAPVGPVSGLHDVILRFADDMEIHIDFFTFSTYDGTETADQKYDRMQWFREARFGQFIHFGPYALPGGVYNGQNVGTNGTEWIMLLRNISKTAYANNIAEPFNPDEFDPAEIVRLAKAAGQKYLVITSKHHDGFSMFDTHVRTFRDYKLNGFGAYEGPDILAGLARECKEQDIKFCVYYSIPDWYDYSQYNWDYMHPGMKDEYKTRMKGQLRELIENYDPALLWFDGGDKNWWSDADGIELYKFIRTLSPGIICNNRLSSQHNSLLGDYGTPEQTIPSGVQNYEWESCMTMNDSWGYKSYSSPWKSAAELTGNLVDIASKGGNYLLNIGPDGKGRVPEQSETRLKSIGEWMGIYGEAIHGTGKSPFLAVREGHKITVKDGRIFVFVKDVPASGKITIPTPGNEIVGVRDMNGGAALAFTKKTSDLVIDTAGLTAHPYYSVIQVEVEGYPEAKVHTNYARQAIQVVAPNVINNQSEYSGQKAVDGDPGTRWATGFNTSAATLELVFAEPVTIDTAYLLHYVGTNNWTKAFQIEYWKDGGWAVAYTGGNPGEEIWCDFDAFTADRIRLNVTDTQNVSVWEFQLFRMRD